MVYKLTEVANLAVYWNSEGEFFKYKTTDELGKLMRDSIYRKDNVPPQNHYLLKPLCGELKVQLNKKKVDMDIPKIISKAVFQQIGFALQEQQFQDAMAMANYFVYYIRGVSVCGFHALSIVLCCLTLNSIIFTAPTQLFVRPLTPRRGGSLRWTQSLLTSVKSESSGNGRGCVGTSKTVCITCTSGGRSD